MSLATLVSSPLVAIRARGRADPRSGPRRKRGPLSVKRLEPRTVLSGGMVTTLVPGAMAFDSFLQPDDGKIVVVGGVGGIFDQLSPQSSGLRDVALFRYTTEGVLDTSFGSGGMVIGATRGDDGALAGVYDDVHDKILIAGKAAWGKTGNDALLARYNLDGTPDTTFGKGGFVTTDLGGNDYFTALVVQPDEKIVAAGHSGLGPPYGFTVARYDSTGKLDPSFGSGGMVETVLGASVDIVENVILREDGRILVGGTAYDSVSSDVAALVLVQYDQNGVLDPSFGDGGTVVHPLGRTHAYDVAVLPDGSIVTAGNRYYTDPVYPYPTYDYPAVAKFNPDGSVDENFGTDPPGIPGLVIQDVTQNEGNSGTTQFDFNVMLTSPGDQLLRARGGSVMVWPGMEGS